MYSTTYGMNYGYIDWEITNKIFIQNVEFFPEQVKKIKIYIIFTTFHWVPVVINL